MADRPIHPRSPGGSMEPSWMTPEYWTEDTSLEDRKQQGKFLYHLADNLVGFEDEYETRGERFGKALNEAGKAALEDPIGFGVDLGRKWRDKLERVRYGPLAYAKQDYASVYDIPPEEWEAMEEEWSMDLMDMSTQPLAPGASSLLTRTPTSVGIFAGNAAAKQRHSQAANARMMKEDGASDREIYDATGYQYSPEQDDWQFVISPKKMELRSKEYEMTDKEFVESITRDSKGKERSTTLEQLIDWPELYENYPALKDYKVRFADQRGASFNAEGREITIGLNYLDSPLSLKEVLSHELQHGVQAFDRTIGGSNPTWVLQNDPEIQRQVGAIQNSLRQGDLSAEEYRTQMKEVYDQGFRRYLANEGEIEARGAGLMNYMSQEEINEMLPSEIKRMTLPKEQDKYRGSVMPTGYAEGGAVTEMKVDPVSGNEVPPGVEPKNVRDDIDAKLSEGEYVIPADVVKYYGVAHFEKLIGKAKDGLKEMQANGRIGGEPAKPEPEDDLPFTDEELTGAEEPVKMAEGGPVFDPSSFTTAFSTFGGNGGVTTRMFVDANGNRRSIMFINGQPIQQIPDGFVEDTPENRATLQATSETVQEAAPSKPEDSRAGRREEEDYATKSTADYTSMSPEGIQKELKAGQVLSSLVGGMLGGPLGARAAKGLVEKEQRKELENQGIPEDQIEDALGKRKETPFDRIGQGLSGIFGNPQNRNDIIGEGKEGNEGKTAKPDFDNSSGDRDTGGSYGSGSGYSSDKDSDRKSSSSGSSSKSRYNKGGLVKRRKDSKKSTKKKDPGKRGGLATRK